MQEVIDKIKTLIVKAEEQKSVLKSDQFDIAVKNYLDAQIIAYEKALNCFPTIKVRVGSPS